MDRTIEHMMAHEIKSRGVTLSFVSRKTGLKYSTLQASIKGTRKLRSDEFFLLCSALRLDPEEFRKRLCDKEAEYVK